MQELEQKLIVHQAAAWEETFNLKNTIKAYDTHLLKFSEMLNCEASLKSIGESIESLIKEKGEK